MKKSLPIIAAVLLIAAMMLTLTSCVKEHRINYTGNVSDLVSAPTSAVKSQIVEIKTIILYDADIEIYVDGKKIERSHYDSDYWGYEFVMPNHDVTVEIKPVNGWKK